MSGREPVFGPLILQSETAYSFPLGRRVLTRRLDGQTLSFRRSHRNRLEPNPVEFVRVFYFFLSVLLDPVLRILPSVPPNVQFQIDDAESEWTFGEGVFDLIHIRHLDVGIRDWAKLIKQAYR